MYISDLLRLSTRMFKYRPLRTSLTILGVSIGIGAVLFLVALGYGLQQLLLEKITTSDSILSLDIVSPNPDILPITDRELMEVRAHSAIEEVSPLRRIPAQLSLSVINSTTELRVVGPSYFRLDGIEPLYGEPLPEKESLSHIVISSAVARLFNRAPEELLGEQVSLTLFLPQKNEEGIPTEEVTVQELGVLFTIVGIDQNENQSYAYIHLSSLMQVDIGAYDEVKVKVFESEQMGEVREHLVQQWFLVSSLSETILQANKVFHGIQIVLALFGLIALIVSAIGMFNTMTITLLERTNEIGIMKSLGASSGDIWLLFLSESVLMGFLGGVGGVVVGFVGGELFNFGVNVLATSLGGQSLQLFAYPLWFIITIIAFSTFMGVLTGLFPSRRAARLNPLDALRYK